MEALDVLRILLCASIVFFHYYCVTSLTGQISVTGFFVLSGFLCAHSLKSHPWEPARFYFSKARRLLPTLITSSVLAFFVVFVKIASSADPHGMISSLNTQLASNNYSLVCLAVIVNPPAWYMLTEIAFLVALPLFLALRQTRFGFTVAFLLFSAVGLLNIYLTIPINDGYYEPISHLWQIMAGIFSYRLYREKRPQWICVTVLALSALFIVLSLAIPNKSLYAFGNMVPFCVAITAFFVVVIPVVAATRLSLAGRSSAAALLAWGSALSYGVFLFHWSVGRIVKQALRTLMGEDIIWLHGLLATAVTLAVAVANKIWWEDKWLRKPKNHAAAHSGLSASPGTPEPLDVRGAESPLAAND